MFFFSKSKYTSFVQCPKMLWLKKYHPEFAVEDPSVQERMQKGNEVGDLAMGLFGDYEEMTATDANGKLDIGKMLANTKDALKRGVENICEASFSHNGLYCAVDILHKEKGGYAIYEVKSSTSPKPIYTVDISYQKYVLEKEGINVTGCYVVNIDSSYQFDGKLDITKLFKCTDISAAVEKETITRDIEGTLKRAQATLKCKNEPCVDLSNNCHSPYDCAFWQYCTQHIPAPSVFDIYGLHFKKKLEYYYNGIIDFAAVKEHVELNATQQRQVDFALQNTSAHVDTEGIKSFLDGLSYPLYFLDFETMPIVVPPFPNCRPYQQIPFQYSLHAIKKENGEVTHTEFLGQSGEDPRRALAEQLVADIPKDACILAFNSSFECKCLEDLANLFHDLSEHLLNIRKNVKDLADPFHDGYYYNRQIDKSFSIKSILPAIYPNDPELDYHNLEGVHNGGEAMNVFPLIKDMPPAEQELARKNLLKYCELDTYAMVKIWQKFKELCE